MSRYTFATNEKHEALQAIRGTDYLLALFKLHEFIRGKIKWNDMLYKGIVYEEVEEEFYSILERYGISLDELI